MAKMTYDEAVQEGIRRIGVRVGEIDRDLRAEWSAVERDLRAEIEGLRAELAQLRAAPKPRMKVRAAAGRSEVE